MLPYYHFEKTDAAIPLICIVENRFAAFLLEQPDRIKNWVNTVNFTAKAGSFCLLHDNQGNLEQVLLGIDVEDPFQSFGALAKQLPNQVYLLQGDDCDQRLAALAWGMGAYAFTRYKEDKRDYPKLLIHNKRDQDWLKAMLRSTYLVRDLINTPAEDMGPEELALAAKELAAEYAADYSEIVGDDLLKENYPAIHAIGRASSSAPRLIDFTWGNASHPKITLVGKGVCFDTGGLDIKPSGGMLLMKKDMGGAANVLGLANLIMANELPVRLRVLIPAVENAIAGNALRPSDVIASRVGKTIEIGNTDGEGRVIVADAIAEACRDKPELIIDFTTLTGAARVAVGTEIAAFFSSSTALAVELTMQAEKTLDPVWQLPLFRPYRTMLNSTIADINNAANSGNGGAITAALFIEEFVTPGIDWLHFDIMAYNNKERPGHPHGGEAMGMRAVYALLCERYCSQ